MFISKDGKNLKKGMLVGLHYNSRNKMFSVVEMKSARNEGNVLGYITKGQILNGYPFIKESERKRVEKEKQKNRHAFLVGYWNGFEIDSLDSVDGELHYNPTTLQTFVDKDLYKEYEIIREIQSTDRINFDLIEEYPLVTYVF